MAKKGLTILRSHAATPEEIAAILAKGHPPFGQGEVQCDLVTCEECWLAWLTSGKVPIPTRKPIR